MESVSLKVNVNIAIGGCRDFLDEDGVTKTVTVIVAPVKVRNYLGETLLSYACSRGRFCQQKCEYAFAQRGGR